MQDLKKLDKKSLKAVVDIKSKLPEDKVKLVIKNDEITEIAFAEYTFIKNSGEDQYIFLDKVANELTELYNIDLYEYLKQDNKEALLLKFQNDSEQLEKNIKDLRYNKRFFYITGTGFALTGIEALVVVSQWMDTNNPNMGMPFIFMTLVSYFTSGLLMANGYRKNEEIKKEKIQKKVLSKL